MGAGQSVPKEVRKAIKHGATEFTWERKPCIAKYIPDAFWNLPLRKLAFNNCGLTEAPIQIFSLSGLQELSLVSNSIQILPQQAKNLKKLRKLDLSSNHLGEFPDFLITELEGTLIDLNVAYNDFKATPTLSVLRILLSYDYIGVYGNNWTDQRLKAITRDTPQTQVRDVIQAIIQELDLEQASKEASSQQIDSEADNTESKSGEEIASSNDVQRGSKGRSQFASGEGADGIAKAFAEFKKSRDSFSALRKSTDGETALPPQSPPEPPLAPKSPPSDVAARASSPTGSPSKVAPDVAKSLAADGAGGAGSLHELRSAGSLGSMRGNLVPVLAAFGKEGQSVKLRPVQRKEDALLLKKLASGDSGSVNGAPSVSNLKHNPSGIVTGAIPSVFHASEEPDKSKLSIDAPSAASEQVKSNQAVELEAEKQSAEELSTASPTTLASDAVETPVVVNPDLADELGGDAVKLAEEVSSENLEEHSGGVPVEQE